MKAASAVMLLFAVAIHSNAQTIISFRQLRYDEDYSRVANDSNPNWYSRMKFQPLSANKETYISIGGDIRYQYQWFRNENWGQLQQDRDGFILTRYQLHADLHAGKKFRAFAQLQSSFANGKQNSISPVDENQLDLHQAFVDYAVQPGRLNNFILRVGRQELLYGSQRLVSVRDGPNNRQSFDAVRMLYMRGNYKADFFYSHFVRSKQKIFDDGFNQGTKFWGAYLVKN
ncbi:MAG TPA: alginate export family protein, partial [Chitinophagaceae bacterium]|nr:alginate export family protein [Chitinophagaceae bacterium]